MVESLAISKVSQLRRNFVAIAIAIPVPESDTTGPAYAERGEWTPGLQLQSPPYAPRASRKQPGMVPQVNPAAAAGMRRGGGAADH